MYLKQYTDITSKMQPLTRKDLHALRLAKLETERILEEQNIILIVRQIYSQVKSYAESGAYEYRITLDESASISERIVSKLKILFPDSDISVVENSNRTTRRVTILYA